MAEIGLVRFAQVAMDVTRAVVPTYRSKYSKRVFTQPQLLSILCLMRYEDWTYREAEVRLQEHSELRMALGLSRVQDHTTLYRFLARLDESLLGHALVGTVARLLPGRSSQPVTVAVDATGLAPGSRRRARLDHHRSGPLGDDDSLSIRILTFWNHHDLDTLKRPLAHAMGHRHVPRPVLPSRRACDITVAYHAHAAHR